MNAREQHWRIGDRDVSCRIEESKGQGTIYVFGRTLAFRIIDSAHVEIFGKCHRFYVLHGRDSSTVWIDGRTYHLQRAQKTRTAEAKTEPGTGEVRTLMPGKLLRLMVAPGDSVKSKQMLAIMESMKMESALFAPMAGRVAEIRFKPGDIVEMGDVVMVIETGS